ncbi:MAG: hypothetical protein BroJett038_09210 [Chloroflexota bacterium]|nr:MAG: hypothetical protein BroJett038_09210 [Chloroflexota bacterium]
MERPGRPLGVSLAIIASALVFSLLPLLQVGMVLTIRQVRLNSLNQDLSEDVPAFSGADLIGGISETELLVQGILGLGFLGLAVLAWRGRPPALRFMLVGAVVLLTGIKLAAIIAQSLAQQNLQIGMSSADSIFQSLSVGQLAVEFLVMLYVVWYMNRGPARAFFRGYYLSHPAGAARPEAAPGDRAQRSEL